MPITFGEQTLGALIAYSRQGDHFGQSEIETLALLASQAAIALDKARLVEEFQRQKRELLGLYDTALATTSALETDILLSRLYEHMRQLLAPDTLVVALIDPAHQALDVVAAFEHDQKLPNFRVPLAEGGLTGWVVRNKQSLLVGDLQTDPLPTTLVHITEPARAWLGVPLVAREQVIGAISVQSFRPRQFDRGHQRFLETLANQVAVALSNARLFEASRHHTEDHRRLPGPCHWPQSDHSM
ncbi:MAG: GAF domain-containing protein [Chloroflexi bacterium]|nr:GAF domain-containing protein [Chloroflexota bacterium]